MNTDFPDELIPASVDESILNYATEAGKEICKDKSIMFCGIVRNAGKHLERNRKDKDSKYRLILVESKIHRLTRYYRKTGQVESKWK